MRKGQLQWPGFGPASTAGNASAFDQMIDWLAPCPWSAASGSTGRLHEIAARRRRPLYSEEERRRRDASVWTTVQGVLAPLQFAVFLVSLALVLNYLLTGTGYETATLSIVIKTVVLYVIMITGSIWEKEIFGEYLFAPAFFWEDVVSMMVLTLHTAYLVELFTGWAGPGQLMGLALAAYGTYALNAAQFVLKLRAARQDAPRGALLPTK